MASKTFHLLALAFVVVLLMSSQVSAAKEGSSHESEVEDAKYGRDDRGYYKGGRGGNYHTNGPGYGSPDHCYIGNCCRDGPCLCCPNS